MEGPFYETHTTAGLESTVQPDPNMATYLKGREGADQVHSQQGGMQQITCHMRGLVAGCCTGIQHLPARLWPQGMRWHA